LPLPFVCAFSQPIAGALCAGAAIDGPQCWPYAGGHLAGVACKRRGAQVQKPGLQVARKVDDAEDRVVLGVDRGKPARALGNQVDRCVQVADVEVAHRLRKAQRLGVALVERDRGVGASHAQHHHIGQVAVVGIDDGAHRAGETVDNAHGGRTVDLPEVCIRVLGDQKVELFRHPVLFAAGDRRFALLGDVAQDMGDRFTASHPLACGCALHTKACADRMRSRGGVRLIAVQRDVVLVGVAPGGERLGIHEPVGLEQLERALVDRIDA